MLDDFYEFDEKLSDSEKQELVKQRKRTSFYNHTFDSFSKSYVKSSMVENESLKIK